MKTQGKIHYAWWTLAACCLLQAGTIGTIYVTTGIFNTPVCNDLGFGLGTFTLAQTFAAAATAALLPFSNYLYRRFGLRTVLLVSGVLFYASEFLMGNSYLPIHWYVLNVVQGAAAAVLYRTSSVIILCNWFKQRTGTAVGLAAAAGTGTGVFINPLGSWCIATFGWRMTYRILALASAAVVLPLIIFVIRMRPQEKGMLPYGVDVGNAEAASRVNPSRFATRRRTLVVSVLMVIGIGCSMFTGGYFPHLPNYSVFIGLDVSVGALMTSCVLAGTMTAKLFAGTIFDRCGAVKTQLFLTVTAVVGFLGYFIVSAPAPLYVFAYVTGLFMCTSQVTMPLFARAELGDEMFDKVYPYMMLFSVLMSSVANSSFGYVVDFTGSYSAMFISCIIAVLANFGLILLTGRLENANREGT